MVGGTGMLAGALRLLARQAVRLVLVTRGPGPLADEIGAEPVALAWSSPMAPSRVAALHGGFDLGVIWLHDGPASWRGRSRIVWPRGAGDPGAWVNVDEP